MAYFVNVIADEYLSGTTCLACPAGCATCTSATTCTSAATGFFLDAGVPKVS
jgi:hypothetical protein